MMYNLRAVQKSALFAAILVLAALSCSNVSELPSLFVTETPTPTNTFTPSPTFTPSLQEMVIAFQLDKELVIIEVVAPQEHADEILAPFEEILDSIKVGAL